MTIEDARALRLSFPRSLAREQDVLIDSLPAVKVGFSIERIGPLVVAGETIEIPYRIHLPQPSPSTWATCSDSQRRMLQCLYSRHHDGHIREAALRSFVHADLDWTPPFIVQLASEYVAAISQVVLDNIGVVGTPRFRQFCSANAAFLLRCRARAISYWDCYYRRDFPRYRDCPAIRVLDAAIRAAHG